jgi:uncharacterized protein YjiS (DUF1127 family)
MAKNISLIILMILNNRIHKSSSCSEALAATRRRIARFFKQLSKALRNRRQIAALAELDDRVLEDIGVSRGEVQEVMSRPFWAFNPLERKHWWRPGGQSLDALARLDDSDICKLSETGQRLRRDARRPH